MLNRILVPLDGSELAERALTYATALASQTGARIVLLRAATSHTLVGVDARERQTGAIQEATQYIDQVAERVRQRGLTCETVVRFGHAPECITESARTRGVDLIVMATHGRTGPGRWIFGSVAEAVVAQSPVPVLVQQSWQPLFGEPMLTDQPKLIVPLDGSAFAETVLEYAATLAEDLHGKLVLVRVEDDPIATHAALQYVPLIQARVAETHPQLPIDIDVRVGEPERGIADAVAQVDAALVVMATHGRAGVKRAVVGSVAGKVLQQGDAPVVLMRPAPAEGNASVPASVSALSAK